MKSEFTLALNQICSERNLPREIITQVLESALATSYRKNANIMNSQNVAVKVDIESGDMRVFVEKEVVEAVLDDRTEVSLEEAKLEQADAGIGDCILVDVTMRDFGRIAAQNVKQMIVQKLREAERDFQYNAFAEREGEVVHGVVHNITPAGVVLNLGRAEGVLASKEQIPGERHALQQRLRAYVTEVKRSSRGPQIMLSRAHRNMLRRLLEIEVPEIQKGQVEIKSIAREPGSRSKVAVAALQTGVDPVGACVGQRGTRIQGIVNELNGEKIDVIEWSDDPAQYITKSLGPAKVLAVHPSADTRNPKSATVVVPDDQLSLAIGREGQNARLAAKLTGWHIDIKSGSEALSEAMVRLAEDDKAQQWVGADVVQAVPALRELLVRQRVLPAALSPEEFLLAKRALDSVFDYLAASQPTAESEEGARNAEMSRQRREAHAAALASIPRAAFTLPIERLELSTRVMQHLASSGILSVGQLMERRVGGDEGLLSIEGIGAKALSEVKAALDRLLEIAQPAGVETIPAGQAGPAAAEPTTDEVAEPATAIAPPEMPEPAPAAAAVLEVTAAPEAAAPEAAAPEAAAPEAAAPEAVAASAEGASAAQPGEAVQAVAAEGEVQDERSPEQIFLDAMAEEEGEAGDAGAKPAKDGKKKEKKKAGVRDRVLIYDEELGRTIVQRSRKPGRAGEFLDEIEEG